MLESKPLSAKQNYLKLINIAKKSIWVDKLEFVKTQKLQIQQLININLLISEINKLPENAFFINEKINEIALGLVEQFPKTDFIQIFSSIDKTDLKYTKEEICLNCKEDLMSMESYTTKYETYLSIRHDGIDGDYDAQGDLKSCNCRWLCTGGTAVDGNLSCTSDNCDETTIGCGFLWLGSCKRRDTSNCDF